MVDGRAPRPSTDEEHAPLLQGSNGHAHEHRSFGERVAAITHEPLTTLSKVLLVLLLLLLLLASVFIGLFAGAAHKLSRMGEGHHTDITATITATRPYTVTATRPTKTLTATVTSAKSGIVTTAVSTSVLTKVSTVVSSATDVRTVTTTNVRTTQITTTAISATTDVRTTTDYQTKTRTVKGPQPTGGPDADTCYSGDCIQLSATILASLDTSVDPCESFYKFANNGWLKQNPLPADKGSYGNFNALAKQNKDVIRSILESDGTPSLAEVSSYDAQILGKLRGMYSSCMDEKRLNKIGEAPLKNLVKTIKELYAGKDLDLPPAEKRVVGRTAALAFLHSRGVPALFSFEIEGDAGRDPNEMTLWFNQPDLGLPSKEYYKEISVLPVYQDVIQHLLAESWETDEEDRPWFKTDTAGVSKAQSLLQLAGKKLWPPCPWPPCEPDDDDPHKPVDFRRLARNVVEFETKIAEASLDLDILYQDPIATYNPLPISNLTETLTQFRFNDYFATFTPRGYPEKVIMYYPAYAQKLSKILNETPSDVLLGYYVARAGLTLASYLGMETSAWKAQRELVELLSGIKKGAVGERSEYCIGIVESTLGFAAGRYFSNITFGGESRKKGTKVITDIVDSFKTSLKSIAWMDHKSAKAAAEKADALAVKVGYPLSPDTTDAHSIWAYYYLVTIDENDFFGNVLGAEKSDVFKQWLKLGKQRDRQEWLMWPSMVNAYYNPPGNEIVFPAGILQPPFFSQKWPGYLSYGSFGMVAAHELTHAFDSAGRLYNQQGKLEEWWTKKTSEGFRKRQKCIVDQYSSYYVEDDKGKKVYVNGNLTSGENIGDSGIIQAYRAWKAQYNSSLEAGNEYLLPGLDYTRDQLFFISFARAWAQNIKPAAAVQRVRTDPHSPNNFRVDGTLSNVPEFAKAFKCSADAKLNPPMEKRCLFW